MLEYLSSGKVVLVKGAEKIPVVKKLISNDRSSDKKFVDGAFTYTYFMYRKGSKFESMFPRQRAIEVSKIYFSDINAYKKFEENQAFKDFRDYYLKLQYSTKEQTAQSVLGEIEDLISELKTIKFWVDGEVEVEVEVMVPKTADSTEMVPKIIKQKVKTKRDNMKEKLAAMKAINSLLEQEDNLKASIRKDIIEKKNEASKSLMDNGTLDYM